MTSSVITFITKFVKPTQLATKSERETHRHTRRQYGNFTSLTIRMESRLQIIKMLSV